MDAPHSTALLKNRAVAQPAAGTCTVRSSSGLATVRSRRSDTMCSTSASGTATVGISASGSRNSGAVDGVTSTTRNSRKPMLPATIRSRMPSTLKRTAPARPVPRASRRATKGALSPMAMSPRPAGIEGCRPVTLCHHDQEQHPHDPQGVWQGEACGGARLGEDSGNEWDPGGQKQRDQGADYRNEEPGYSLPRIL